MTLESAQEVENTRVKLRMLEEMYRRREEEPGEMTYARRPTMRSLKRLMNQLTEEIVRYESRAESAAGRRS
jgi:hypothetical protein